MKRYTAVILVIALCLLFAACENTNSKQSSSGLDFTASDYSSYSTVQSDEASDIISDISSTENLQTESSSEAQTSSVQSSTPVSSSSPALIQNSVPQSTQSSSKPALPACSHNYIQTANTATCTQGGQATYTCSLCKATYKEQTTSFGHKWDGHKCKTCGTIDEDKMKENLYNWAVANSVEENFSKYYYLPSDSRYKFSAIGKGNYIFYYDDEATSEHISVSVYGFEKNKCYINYILNDLQIEGEFPMDAVHSTDRNFFNVMNAASNDAAAKKDELTTSLRSKIDGFLKKFEIEMLIPKTDITLNDLGFKCF